MIDHRCASNSCVNLIKPCEKVWTKVLQDFENLIKNKIILSIRLILCSNGKNCLKNKTRMWILDHHMGKLNNWFSSQMTNSILHLLVYCVWKLMVFMSSNDKHIGHSHVFRVFAWWLRHLHIIRSLLLTFGRQQREIS